MQVQARSASASEVQVKDLDEHKLNGMDEEQLLRERREREGESGGTGRESESEPDTDEREGEERGEMSGETRERARASASQTSWTSGVQPAVVVEQVVEQGRRRQRTSAATKPRTT